MTTECFVTDRRLKRIGLLSYTRVETILGGEHVVDLCFSLIWTIKEIKESGKMSFATVKRGKKISKED